MGLVHFRLVGVLAGGADCAETLPGVQVRHCSVCSNVRWITCLCRLQQKIVSCTYVTGLRKNGLIAGLAKLDFFPEMASTKLRYCLTKI